MTAENLYIPNTKWWIYNNICSLSQPSILNSDYSIFNCVSHDGRNISAMNVTLNLAGSKIIYSLAFNNGEPLNNHQSLLQQIIQYFLSSSKQNSFISIYEHTSNKHCYSQHVINNFILGLMVVLFIHHLLLEKKKVFYPFDLIWPEVNYDINVLTTMTRGAFEWVSPVADLFQTINSGSKSNNSAEYSPTGANSSRHILNSSNNAISELMKTLMNYYLTFVNQWSDLFPLGEIYQSPGMICLIGYSRYLQELPELFQNQHIQIIHSIEKYLEQTHSQLKITLSGYGDAMAGLKNDVRIQNKQLLDHRSSLIKNLEDRQQELMKDLEHQIDISIQTINQHEIMSVQILKDMTDSYDQKFQTQSQDILTTIINKSKTNYKEIVSNIQHLQNKTIQMLDEKIEKMESDNNSLLYQSVSSLEIHLMKHVEKIFQQQLQHIKDFINNYIKDCSKKSEQCWESTVISKINELIAKNDKQQGRINHLEQKITRLVDRDKNLNTKIANLEETINELKSDITNLSKS